MVRLAVGFPLARKLRHSLVETILWSEYNYTERVICLAVFDTVPPFPVYQHIIKLGFATTGYMNLHNFSLLFRKQVFQIISSHVIAISNIYRPFLLVFFSETKPITVQGNDLCIQTIFNIIIDINYIFLQKCKHLKRFE